jgi:serine/threonine-protein kinase
MIRKDPKKRFQDAGPVIRKVRKELSRFNARDIRVVMVENLTTDRTDEPQYRPRRHTVAKLSFAASALVVLASLGAVAWQSGLVHRTVLSPWYTPVSVRLSLPASIPPESEIRFRAAFFRDDGASIPEVQGARRELFALDSGTASGAETERSAATAVLSSGEVHLRPGAYRVKVTGGPRVWWQSVTVGKKRVDVAIDFGDVDSRPLAVHAVAVDAVSGMDLTARTRFLVLSGTQWIPLETFDTGRLVSDSVWKLRAVSPGYRSQDFSLRIEWFQDELFLRSALELDTARTQGGK